MKNKPTLTARFWFVRFATLKSTGFLAISFHARARAQAPTDISRLPGLIPLPDLINHAAGIKKQQSEREGAFEHVE